MSDNKKTFQKLAGELSQREFNEVFRIYQGHSKHAVGIYTKNNEILINWLFILNTGGIISVLSNLKINSLMFSFILFGSLIFFILAVIALFISLNVEKNKFETKGAWIDEMFETFQNGEITAEHFFDELANWKGTQWPWYLEIISLACFAIGVILGLWALVS